MGAEVSLLDINRNNNYEDRLSRQYVYGHCKNPYLQTSLFQLLNWLYMIVRERKVYVELEERTAA